MNNYMICADCSTPDPTWASINRGVLLCNECCGVHRVLGTHISHIRSLTAPNWPPVLKEMVYSLVNKGSNTLWEHQLHDTTHYKIKIKKPNPRDRLHPTKHDFIVLKYKHLSFLPRISNKDNFNSIADMSKQLHASVRTSNLETCLRLLSLGADPNYMHPDRGTTPLHVASQAGQAMVVELLVVNGADPSRLDRLGHTPEECARIAGHHQLADRLIECQYELTDKLSNFISGRKPVHSIGEHYIVPQVGMSTSAGMADACKRLQEINNDLFEELAADVYDEVDRRETDSLWLATQQLQSSVAFLPVNPTLSPLRNQGRQKLATLNAQEFAQLVIDILLDTKRRMALYDQKGEKSGTVVPMTSGDNAALFDSHDYDEVPMDENRSPPPLPSSPSAQPEKQPRASGFHKRPLPEIRSSLPPTPSNEGGIAQDDDWDPDYAEPSDPPPLRQSGVKTGVSGDGIKSASVSIDRVKSISVSADEVKRTSVSSDGSATVSRVKFDLIKDKLKQVQNENEQLRVTNQQLHMKLDELQQHLNKVIEDNVHLRSAPPQQQQRSPNTPTSPLPVILEPKEDGMQDTHPEVQDTPPDIYAAVDMTKKSSRSSTLSGSRSSVSDHQAPPSSSPAPPPGEIYSVVNKKTNTTPPNVMTPPPIRQDTPLSDSPFEDSSEQTSSSPVLPPLEQVNSKIKTITQPIQELLLAAQSHEQTNFGPCSLKIVQAVKLLTNMFPQGSSLTISDSLREVTQASSKLWEECRSSTSQSDLAYRTRLIINSAYDVAKACRHLVMCVEQELKKPLP